MANDRTQPGVGTPQAAVEVAGVETWEALRKEVDIYNRLTRVKALAKDHFAGIGFQGGGPSLMRIGGVNRIEYDSSIGVVGITSDIREQYLHIENKPKEGRISLDQIQIPDALWQQAVSAMSETEPNVIGQARHEISTKVYDNGQVVRVLGDKSSDVQVKFGIRVGPDAGFTELTVFTRNLSSEDKWNLYQGWWMTDYEIKHQEVSEAARKAIQIIAEDRARRPHHEASASDPLVDLVSGKIVLADFNHPETGGMGDYSEAKTEILDFGESMGAQLLFALKQGEIARVTGKAVETYAYAYHNFDDPEREQKFAPTQRIVDLDMGLRLSEDLSKATFTYGVNGGYVHKAEFIGDTSRERRNKRIKEVVSSRLPHLRRR
jgi:hypothetical protein